MRKTILKIVGLFIVGMVGGIFADQIFWPYFVERPLFYQYRLEQTPVYVNETKEITVQENTALENAVEKVGKTALGVRTKLASGIILEGSGLILTSDGLVVTLPELVPQGAAINFFWDGQSVPAQVLKRDFKNNLALIKIDRRNLPTVGFADPNKMKIGERVFLAGVIFEKGIPGTMANEGIVKTFDENFIYTNIFEKYTLAGSPLFDIEGSIVGLNTIDQGGKIIAIPAQKIKTFAGF